MHSLSKFRGPRLDGSLDTRPDPLLSDKSSEALLRKEAQESLEQSFTPSLARRLSRQFIEQTRKSLPRSPLIPREKYQQQQQQLEDQHQQQPYRYSAVRRSHSLLDHNGLERKLPKRSISLFDDDELSDRSLPPLPRQTMTLGRKYREPIRSSFHSYQDPALKIQEEPAEEPSVGPSSEYATTNSTSCETSPNESTSNILGRDLENRLLAAENLIKASKMRNLGPNLNANYRDLDKCDKESLSAISDAANATIVKRRNCIPSLRLRSRSLSREAPSPEQQSCEKSLFSKLFGGNKEAEAKEKPKRRISRFLRPDFFDTPREESRYVREKEEREAAEKERRRTRFTRRRSEKEAAAEKELKNEANLAAKVEKQQGPTKSGFLHSLEKKLEKLRSGDAPEAAEAEPSPRADEAAPKSKVSSVLGLFKNAETATSKSQTNILSKFKKSPYKGSQSDSLLGAEAASKIPKCVAPKSDARPFKNMFEKTVSPPKGLGPEVVKKTSKLPKKTSPDKVVTKPVKPELVKVEKKKSPEKSLDNRQMDEESKLKKKKKIVPPSKVDEEKKVKKLAKPKDEEDGTKKKRIARVVKKVASKSPDEEKAKDKVQKTLVKKTPLKKEAEPSLAGRIKTKSPEIQAIVNGVGSKAVRSVNSESAIPQTKACRSNLKLDFSKIPQHSSSRNTTPPKKESIKEEVVGSRANSKVIENQVGAKLEHSNRDPKENRVESDGGVKEVEKKFSGGEVPSFTIPEVQVPGKAKEVEEKSPGILGNVCKRILL